MCIRDRDVMTNGRGKDTMGQTAYTYMYDLIAETLTQEPADEIKAKAEAMGLKFIKGQDDFIGFEMNPLPSHMSMPGDGPFFYCKPKDISIAASLLSLLDPDAPIGKSVLLTCHLMDRKHIVQRIADLINRPLSEHGAIMYFDKRPGPAPDGMEWVLVCRPKVVE